MLFSKKIDLWYLLNALENHLNLSNNVLEEFFWCFDNVIDDKDNINKNNEENAVV